MKKIFIITLLILAGFVTVFASGHIVSITASTNVTCFGTCNGSATAVASGGIGPYSYAWTGPSGYTSTNATANGMCAGTYTITATDSSDMSIATLNAWITQPLQLVVSSNVINTSCGVCNGSATAIVSGGSPGYNYNWSNGSSAMTASGLCAGNYTLTVTDSHGCTATTNAIVTLSSGFNAFTSSTPTNCGICNGVASVDSVINGSAPYYYTWSNAATTAIVNNLCHGTYSVTIHDANGCSVSYNVIVQELNTLNSTISSIPTTCNVCNGSATVTPAGGNPPYLILWANSATDSSITGLCSGNYIVTITDNNSCSQTLMTNVNSVYSFSASFTNTPTTCNNSSDGAVNITISGGTLPFAFVWSNGATTQNLNGLAIGTYTVTITDSTNCARIYSTSIISGSGLLGTITHTNTPCGSCTGTANLSVTGGVGPYSYLWSGPSGFNSTLQSIVGLCVGGYYVTITDSNNCIKTLYTGITSTNNMTATISNTQTNCNCNGTASVTVSGGVGPYAYSWSGPSGYTATGQVITGLCAGYYFITITDSNSCTKTSYTNISQLPTTLNATIANTPTACNSCTGTAIVYPTSGVTPYTYLWTTGATTQNVISLCSGNYTVTITDSVNCKKYISTNVISGNNLQQVLDTIINVSCSNNALGTISVHATGGNPPYNYYWNNGQITSTISNLNIGYYTLHLYDADSCSVFATYHVNNTYNIYASVNSINANCNNNGLASISVSGLHPPYSFYWSDPLHQTTSTAINLAPGYYQATITDAIGCTRVVSTYINNTCLNVIKGVIYFDANQNCIQDSAEPGIPNIVVYSTGNYYGITNFNGQYVIYTPYMNNTIHPNNNFLNCYQSTCPNPAILYANFTNFGDTLYNNNFGYFALPSFFDLRINSTYTSQINPGFNKSYYLYTYNNSPTPQNALIRLSYDQNLVYVNSSNSGINNSSLHTVEWNAVNIPAWSYYNYLYANFYVPSSVPIGDTICALHEILPIIGDGCPNNNMWNICQITTGSFDPNMKEVFPKGQGAQGFILQSDSVLNYTVHFQNTGNDTAFTVIVIDTLSQYLEPGTFVKGISSHPCTLTITEQGILTFRFDNILLPDSNINESGSNGYVNYTVNLKPSLPIGTEIKNTASIFFDFNAAVITNTTLNTIASPLQIKEIENKVSVSAYPNPFKDYTTIKIKTDETNMNYSFELIDIIGNDVIKIDNIKTKEFNIVNSKLVEGIYFYIVKSNEKIIGSGKLIKN